MYYMNNPGYFVDSLHGRPWYRCQKCRFDTSDRTRILNHVKYKCRPRPFPEMDIPLTEWIDHQKTTMHGLKLAVSLLTWNTAEASIPAACALIAEMNRLANLNVTVKLFWVDNGSTDGTVEALNVIFGDNLAAKSLWPTNFGQSVARNWLRNQILASDCNMWSMVDGDIEVIPYSLFAQARYLFENPLNVGCIGMYSRNCTHVLDLETATQCRKLNPWMVTEEPQIAWTNYGTFRRSVIRLCEFEDKGPFDGPGWGFEDDDFYMQMVANNYTSHNTVMMRHLHRRRHSSIKLLDPKQYLEIYNARKQFLWEKWHKHENPTIHAHITRLKNQTPPVLEY